MRRTNRVLLSIMVCAVIVLFAGHASAAAKGGSGADNSVNVGFAALPGIFDTEATVFFVEFERKTLEDSHSVRKSRESLEDLMKTLGIQPQSLERLSYSELV